MKRFLRDAILFATFISVLVVGLIVSLNYFVETDDFYHVDERVKYIVVGDSHPECAYNDSLIDNFKNFAQSGESYFYTYLKTKEILEHNPTIKRAYIEFNNGQIIKNIDNCIWDDKHVSAKLPKYAIAMDWYDYSILIRHNLSGTLNAQSVSIMKNMALLKKHDRKMGDFDWGGYKNLTNNGAEKIKGLKDQSDSLQTKLIEISETNIQYLLKTIKACKDRNVEVVLIRSPVHKKYLGSLNEYSFQYVKEKYLREESFLDFKTYALDDNQFADVHHLNNLGANQFSVFFNEYIKNEALTKE